MKSHRIIGAALIAASSLLALAGAGGGEETAPAGQKLFLQYKCNGCHTVQALKIEKKEIEGETEDTGDRKPPDLSGVGKKRTADWIQAYMLKKEAIEGQRHKKKFRGTEEELKTLSGWLAEQKVDVKKKK